MSRALRNTLCRLLIALTAWMPFQMANASMIGTDQTAAYASGASDAARDRAQVLSFLERSEVAAQLAGLGVDSAAAKDRVNAMSDQEVGALAQRIDALPAGGIHGTAAWVVVLLIIGGIVWWAMKR
jgi:hypothetical protein